MKKTLFILLFVAVLTGCYTAKQFNVGIKEYRKQYTVYANELLNNTNVDLSAALSNKLEQYKQTNLHLFLTNK